MWIDSATTNFDEYWLTDSEFFCLWIEFNCGLENVVGSDDFRIFVSTPAWLGEKCSHAGVRGGKTILIVNAYGLKLITSELQTLVESCERKHKDEVVTQIARFADW